MRNSRMGGYWPGVTHWLKCGSTTWGEACTCFVVHCKPSSQQLQYKGSYPSRKQFCGLVVLGVCSNLGAFSWVDPGKKYALIASRCIKVHQRTSRLTSECELAALSWCMFYCVSSARATASHRIERQKHRKQAPMKKFLIFLCGAMYWTGSKLWMPSPVWGGMDSLFAQRGNSALASALLCFLLSRGSIENHNKGWHVVSQKGCVHCIENDKILWNASIPL